MKKIIILSLLTFVLSCSKEDEPIVKTYGTKLISIKYSYEDENWDENYSYNSENQLVTIENFRSLGRRYEIEYDSGRVNQITTFRIDENKKIFRDSILYNEEGTINKIYKFSSNSEEDMQQSFIYEYKYDNSGKLNKTLSYSTSSEEYFRIKKYYWNGENIERIEQFNGNGKLYYEFFYTYDDKVNYKKNIPIHIPYPLNLV